MRFSRLRGLEVSEVLTSTPDDVTDDAEAFVVSEIIELYTLTAAALPLFKELGLAKRYCGLYTLHALSYIRQTCTPWFPPLSFPCG